MSTIKILTALLLLGAVAAIVACAPGVPTLISPVPFSSNQSTSVGINVQTEGGAYTDVTAAELKGMLDQKDFFFVNTHTPYKGEIAETDAFIPYNTLDDNLAKFPADHNAKIVVYCRGDMMSTVVAKELVKKGYTNVWNLTGGMAAWEKAGLPLLQQGPRTAN